MLSSLVFLSLLSLMGSLLFSNLEKSRTYIGNILFQKKIPSLFLFIQKKLLKGNLEDSAFLFRLNKNLYLLSYMALITYIALQFFVPWTLLLIIVLILFSILMHSFTEILTESSSSFLIAINASVALPFLLFSFPISFPLCFLKRINKKEKPAEATRQLKYKILQLIQDPRIVSQIDSHDYRLISSVALFRDRIVKEIMVPRIHVRCLSANLTILEAAKIFLQEEYSRIPIYETDMDHILGVLLFKDLLQFCIMSIESKDSHFLQTSIKSLVKPILYTPETKKISTLLQEFRQNRLHLAIVVDEYGGTEGIVTIEDILEELVGEIADEYDEEAALFQKEKTGGWIIDAKISIVDLEKELKIQIPKSLEYDTLGGYIYHKTGTIPLPGFQLHHDNFDLVVIRSNEKSIEQVRIVPLQQEKYS